MGRSTISCLVIRCSKRQFEAKEINSFLRIKSKLSAVASVLLAVEDAGEYEFYVLRDIYYFANIKGTMHTDKPYTICWKERPEISNDTVFAPWRKCLVKDFLNSNAGLDKGYTESALDANAGIGLSHCMRFFVDPKTTTPRKQVRRTVERNPFLKSATIGEMIEEMKRRGYTMTYEPIPSE